MINKLVSIIIPTKNASKLLPSCLRHLRQQNHKAIEIIVVDSNSADRSLSKKIAKKYHCRFFITDAHVSKGLYDASSKRIYGASKAKGQYIYHVDADMELTKYVITEAIRLCSNGFDAVIVPEDSFGEGVWARAKNLERRFFWGDDMIESPRFFVKKVWDKLGGFDKKMGSAEDRDLHQRTIEAGYKIGRTKSLVMHNEGRLTLWYLIKKSFSYKREILKYIRRRPFVGIKSYIPIRISHIAHWKMFLFRSLDTFFLIVMKIVESVAGALGVLYSILRGEFI